jgi:hypothetical protein
MSTGWTIATPVSANAAAAKRVLISFLIEHKDFLRIGALALI